MSAAAATRNHISQIRPEGRRVEAVDDRVAARVEVAEDKENVVDVLRYVPENAWLEPIPNPQDIVGCPADHEGGNNHYCHLQGLHASLGDQVCTASS